MWGTGGGRQFRVRILLTLRRFTRSFRTLQPLSISSDQLHGGGVGMHETISEWLRPTLERALAVPSPRRVRGSKGGDTCWNVTESKPLKKWDGLLDRMLQASNFLRLGLIRASASGAGSSEVRSRRAIVAARRSDSAERERLVQDTSRPWRRWLQRNEAVGSNDVVPRGSS